MKQINYHRIGFLIVGIIALYFNLTHNAIYFNVSAPIFTLCIGGLIVTYIYPFMDKHKVELGLKHHHLKRG